jgi:hypothetical protein
MAQTYSQNTVGYVNLNLGAGFTMIANPLDAGGNTLAEVLPTAPDGAVLYKFNPTTGQYEDAQTFFTGVGWFPDATKKLAPGEGAFIQLQAAATVTFVGQVHEGNINNPVPSGFSIKASQLPIEAPLGKASDPEKTPTTAATTLRFPAGDGDVVFFFDPVAHGFKDAVTFFNGVGWFPGDANGPAPKVGESFFVQKVLAADWSRNYTVSP